MSMKNGDMTQKDLMLRCLLETREESLSIKYKQLKLTTLYRDMSID